jgi:HNH endonuclease
VGDYEADRAAAESGGWEMIDTDKNGQQRGKWKRVLMQPLLRFWSMVKIGDDCWEWQGAVNKVTGYGIFNDGCKAVSAHSWVANNVLGWPPRRTDGTLLIDHKCRNRKCVRPSHLRLTTQLVNARNSGHALKTHCNRGHPLSGDNLYRDGKGWRRCRECARQLDANRYRTSKEKRNKQCQSI